MELQHLDMERRCLWRNAGCLEIGVRHPNSLSRTKRTKGNRISIPATDYSRIGYDKSGLTVDIIGIADRKDVLSDIDESDSSGGDIHRGTNLSPGANQKCVGLRRNAAGHGGRKDGVDPHSSSNIAETHRNAGSIQYDCISPDIQP